MNSLTILFLTVSAISGTVVLCIGLANFPQPSTTYVQGSGDSAETIAQKNRTIILNSYEFKLVMIGTGIIFLTVCLLIWAKYRDEQLRILDEERLERRRVSQLKKEAVKNKSPVQQLVPKSAELDSTNTKTNIKVNNSKVVECIYPLPRLRPILNIKREPYPKPILKKKNVGFNSISQNLCPYTVKYRS